MSRLILPFDEIDKTALPRVGGKGANLGEMAQAGFPIPDGFCVTTDAYRLFASPVNQQVQDRLDGLDPGDLDALRLAGTAVRGVLSACPLPDAVTAEVTRAWKRARPETAYAVRSSATAEDLPTASFAGQQDTYLNIRGLDALLLAIRDCFVSLYTDRAILYRIQKGFAHDAVALSVVVQEMVLPEVSGILFTADPMSGHRDIASIDASYGLGEALVSGLVTADLFRSDKASGDILSRRIGSKEIAILPLKNGGTETVDVPLEKQAAASLSDPQVAELTALGVRIEAHYQKPQDIEWALVGDRFYITQSRPITSLYPTPLADDESPRIYLSLSHLQVMTDPLPPLVASVWRQVPTMGLNERGAFSYYRAAGGRIYADISPILRHPILGRVFTNMLGVADKIAQSAIRLAAQDPRFRRGTEVFPLRRVLWALRHSLRKVPTTLLFGPPKDVLEQANAAISLYRARPVPQGPKALDEALAGLRDVVPISGGWIPRLAAGILSQRFLRGLLPDSAAPTLDAFERGTQGNVVTEMNLRIGDLADIAAEDDAVRLALTELSGGTPFARDAVPEAFLTPWDLFLQVYGDRTAAEMDLSRPRWREDPAPLAQMILGLSQRAEKGAHHKHFRQLVDTAQKARTALPAQSAWIKRPLVRRFIANAHALMPLREHHKLLIVIGASKVRQVILHCAEDLVAQGVLQQAGDVWFLEVHELRDLMAAPDASIQGLIAERKLEHAHNATRTPPRVMTDRGHIPTPDMTPDDAPEGALIGTPVSAGVVKGIARVVIDPATEKLSPGEILVAPFTDPGWTPLFFNASGLVTEVGGLMTHGSVVAREYDIPAVVGVPGATTQIRTGDTIKVDGTTGFIEILEATA